MMGKRVAKPLITRAARPIRHAPKMATLQKRTTNALSSKECVLSHVRGGAGYSSDSIGFKHDKLTGGSTCSKMKLPYLKISRFQCANHENLLRYVPCLIKQAKVGFQISWKDAAIGPWLKGRHDSIRRVWVFSSEAEQSGLVSIDETPGAQYRVWPSLVWLLRFAL